MNRNSLGILTVLAVAVAAPVYLAISLLPDGLRLRIDTRSVSTVADAIDLFKANGFDPEKHLHSAEPALPPVFLAELPGDMKAVRDADRRKAVFVSIVLPHVLYANERLRADRRRLERIHAEIAAERTLRSRDRKWLMRMAETYRTKPMDTEELLRRVDIVPPRLAVAQAVQESGWGTSRFARSGNALFGQHAPVGAGAIQATGNAKVALKAFDTLQASVRDYMHNLNRHRAYRTFRTTRAEMRARNAPLDAIELAHSLQSYSEEGRLYVERLLTVMSLREVSAVRGASFSGN